MEAYLQKVEELIEEAGFVEQYHCKIKDNSMLRMIHIETKRRLFVKEEHCDAYVKYLEESTDHFEEQFSKVSETNYFQI